MKKIIAMLLAGIMTIGLTGCQSNGNQEASEAPAQEAETGNEAETENETEAPAAAEEEITVAGIVFQDDQFMNMLTQGYVAAAEEYGVKILTDNTNNDSAKEVELINTYLAQGVKGLVIAPLNADASVAALRKADEEGMKVALTNIDLTDADFIVAGYTSNDYNNCYLAGTEAAEILKEKAGGKTVKIATLQFASQLPDISKNRIDGYLTALDDAGVAYEVVANQDAWLQDTALEAGSGIITANPGLDVIIAVNDGGTIGAVTAVENAGKSDQIMVFGHDGSDQISSMILDEDGPLQSVIAQDPYGMGYEAMSALIRALQGEDYSETKGKCAYMDGIVLSCRDREAVNSWRVDNGYDEIQ